MLEIAKHYQVELICSHRGTDTTTNNNSNNTNNRKNNPGSSKHFGSATKRTTMVRAMSSNGQQRIE